MRRTEAGQIISDRGPAILAERPKRAFLDQAKGFSSALGPKIEATGTSRSLR